MNTHEQLLLINKAWAQERVEDDPLFFKRMASSQSPHFLWIGCSDSRVSPNEITQSAPGTIFIHRNVANLVVSTDLNFLSVLQYAVEVLEVRHVIVCGHYGCGGVKAALTQNSFGLIDEWLHNIKNVYRYHQTEIDRHTTEEERLNALIEWNVREQLLNIAKTSIVQKSWKEHKRPLLHGWVYDLDSGIIRSLLDLTPESLLDHPIYTYKNL